jgi:hypothetical protein
MTLDEQKVDIERQKLRLEERKFHLEQRARLWAPLLTMIPILAIIVGYYFNTRLESQKNAQAHHADMLKLKRQFIDRQLGELYYPIQLRLEKDTAVWILSDHLTKGNPGANTAFSRTIENAVLLPNHEEALGIIAANFSLLKNSDEHFDPTPLMNSINHYQRHVAAYRTLRKLELYDKNPVDVCPTCAWPTELKALITRRIADLEKQRAALSTLE